MGRMELEVKVLCINEEEIINKIENLGGNFYISYILNHYCLPK